MKHGGRPLSRFAAAISARNSHLQIRGTRLRSTVDLQFLSFHQLMNRSFRNSLVLKNFCVAPCYFQIPHVNQYLNRARSQFTRAKTTLLSTFRMNTCKSVSKQSTLTAFRMNTYAKNRGEGPPGRTQTHLSSPAEHLPSPRPCEQQSAICGRCA
jgi:hypothetical protein